MDYDTIIIGAGHNGLVCAAYLAQAGQRVLVCDGRTRPGGAVNSEELFPGYTLDTCSTFHVLIHLTPVVRELGLAAFGLRYMRHDPWAYAPFPDGRSLTFYRDLDRTCASIAAFSPRDATTYRAFMRAWAHFNEAVFATFLEPPTPGALVGRIARTTMRDMMHGRGDASMTGLELLRKTMAGYGRVLAETFESPELCAALAWLAAQSGPPPAEVGSGALLGSVAIYHMVGLTRPVGGSGQLAQALARCLAHHGGELRLGPEAAVRAIIMEGGRAAGVTLQSGERFTARRVVSNAHVQTTLSQLLPPGTLTADDQVRVGALRAGNGIGMTIRCAVDALPAYQAALPADGASPHAGMQLICPSVEYLHAAHADFRAGRPAQAPALIVMTPSALDPTITPPGKHGLYIWAQYHPYALADGGAAAWDHIREREAERLLATLAAYAPNVPGSVQGMYIQSPLDLERNVGFVQGNIMHLDMSLDQMFMLRPLPEWSGYRTPIAGLYLTGASTHPGGGVAGASGRNTARVVLADAERGR